MDELAKRRSVKWILDRFGGLHDLPPEVASVVWVTVYRSMEVGIELEDQGGQRGLMKDMILGGGDLTLRTEQAALKLDFLQEMVHHIRNNPTSSSRLADGQLLVDVLKWGMVDAADMSALRRMWRRRSAKADPLYEGKVPQELYAVPP